MCEVHLPMIVSQVESCNKLLGKGRQKKKKDSKTLRFRAKKIFKLKIGTENIFIIGSKASDTRLVTGFLSKVMLMVSI